MMALVWRSVRIPSMSWCEHRFRCRDPGPDQRMVDDALLIAPTYAWLLCASAFASRSPFLMAITWACPSPARRRTVFFGTELHRRRDVAARTAPVR
jgi:hypothetical protein